MEKALLRQQEGAQAAKTYPGKISVAFSACLITSGVLTKPKITQCETASPAPPTWVVAKVMSG